MSRTAPCASTPTVSSISSTSATPAPSSRPRSCSPTPICSSDAATTTSPTDTKARPS
uniref:Uncharacterized protein n=1 Tax=Arundo donax TaxID=35708 RepID=A0A0A9G4A3_ARUDO